MYSIIYINFCFLGMHIALIFAALYEMEYTKEHIFGIRQKQGLSKIECVLVCQRKLMASSIHEGQCFCFDGSTDALNSNLLDEEKLDSQTTIVFKKLDKSSFNSDYRNVLYGSGATESNPAKSCKIIKQNNPSLTESGFYWIQLNQPTRVYCDMITDGGGWMMVGNTTVTSPLTASQHTIDYIVANKNATSFKILTEMSNGQSLLANSKFPDLDGHIEFTQFRVYCTKPWHQRTIHLVSKANSAGELLKRFVFQEVNNWIPDASSGGCTSAVYFLPEDNSMIKSKCLSNEVKHINSPNGLFDHFLYVPYKNHILVIQLNQHPRMECDDFYQERGFSQLGTWHYFVR